MPSPTKHLPPFLLPPQDRAAWEGALTRGDVFDKGGAGSHWSEGTRKTVMMGYRRWLQFISDTESLALNYEPAQRVVEERVERYVETLRETLTPAGVFNYVKHLYDAIRVMAPHEDWRWLRDVYRSLNRLVTPKAKRHRMVDPDRLLDLGLTLLEETDNGTLASAIRHRDGLIIGLLICRPLRRRNLTNITIGKNLIRVGKHHALVFTEQETKTHERIEFPWPPVLEPQLALYLTSLRPRFKNA